jgi:prepilin-type N-terminal cleavage/methylation domain-containing protein
MSVQRRRKFRSGLTLVEMMLCTAILLIVLAAVGVVLGDGLRGWKHMYDRMYSKLATDSLVASRMLDVVVRRAAGQRLLIGAGGSFVEVYSYADADSPVVDCYARLYSAGGNLYLEQGQLTPRQMSSSRVICESVSSCVFQQLGRSVQMVLTFDDGTQRKTVVSSAFIHGN